MKPELRIISLLENDEPVVLITVIDKQGSGPRSPGAKIVIAEDGTFWGTIGGGQVENNALDFAKKFFQGKAQAATAHFQLKPGYEGENINMLCGGRVSLLFEKFVPGDDIELFRIFQKLDGAAGIGVWVINLDSVESAQQENRFLITKDGDVPPGFAALRAYLFASSKAQRTSHLLEFAGSDWFIDQFSTSGQLVLVGAGHIALEIAKLAHQVNFGVTVSDNRPEFANVTRFPDADSVDVIEDYVQIFDQILVGTDTYIVILTHSHSYDQTALEQALQTDACYIGMIGSVRKREAIYTNLRSQGVSDEMSNSVKCPIGLDIGAESPVEIAISLIAELIKERAR